MRVKSFAWVCGCALIAGTLGCSAAKEPASENLDRQGVAKLEAIEEIAAGLGKNDQVAISLAVEKFTAASMDVRADTERAKQVLEIHKTKVKGKLKGDAGQQVQSVIDAIQGELK